MAESINNSRKSECTKIWNVGAYVWALFNKKYWPAVVISYRDIGLEEPKKNKVWLFWFGDYRVSEMDEKYLSTFTVNFNQVYNKMSSRASINWLTGVHEAIREYGMPEAACLTESKLIDWAVTGFSGHFNKIPCLSDFIFEKLQKIKSKNAKELIPGVKVPATSEKKALLKQIVKNPKLLSSICLACYSSDVVDKHPVFKGSICSPCKAKLKNTYYVIGEDNIKYFCTICASPGSMIVCGIENCGRVFCKTCIDELAYPGARTKILKTDPWFCFVCKPDNIFNGLLLVRKNWQSKVQRLFDNSLTSFPTLARPQTQVQKRPVRVLSLFDGIGTGFVALEKLNLIIQNYFTCEIDNESLLVMKKNYGDKVTPLGDVLKLTEADIKRITPIDLLIGGSPCNDLSLVNPCRKGLYDSEGTGILFFEFYRILTALQLYNGTPFFWVFENVSSMPLQCKLTISRFLQCEPTVIDAAWVSPQHRPRFFWGNLPTLQGQLFENQGPDLQQYLMPGRKATVKKLRTVTTRTNSLKQGPEMKYPVQYSEDLEDNISINELEEVFGFPRHYTEVNGLSTTCRQKLLGKAWSVQVMVLIFKSLQEHFEVRS